MPAGLVELRMVRCSNVTQRARLDHLTALRVLQSAGTDLLPATIVACRARTRACGGAGLDRQITGAAAPAGC